LGYKRFVGKYTSSQVDTLKALADANEGQTTRQIAQVMGKPSIGGVSRTLNWLKDNTLVRGELSPRDDDSPPAWMWSLTDEGRRVHVELAEIAAGREAS